MTKRWWQITAFWVALGGLFALWLAYRYAGAYQWLSEWQLRYLGFYLPASTQALIVAVIALPLIAALLVLRRRDHRRRIVVPHEAVALRYRSLVLTLAAVLAVASIGTLLIGLVSVPRGDGDLTAVSVDQPGAITEAHEGRATLTGGQPERRVVLYRQSYVIGEKITPFAMLRGPVGLSGTVAAGRFFVQLERDSEGRYFIPDRTGILVRNGLPGPVRVLYRILGVPVMDEHYVLFRDRATLWLPYWQAAAQFGFMAVLFALAGWVQQRRIRKLRREAVSISNP